VRVALFGSGGTMPATVLRSLAATHDVGAVVRPAASTALRTAIRPLAIRLGLRPPDPLADECRRLRIGVVHCRGGDDPAARANLARLDLDAIVIASFPCLLSPALYGAARAGAINMHCSLLPRHRGPLPMFWVYYQDDRETGVTVHRVTAKADEGAIFGQARFDLPRGHPIQQLYDRSSEAGAALILEALAELERGGAGRPQDETRATRAPRLQPGVRMIDFAAWPVERVWHLLAGMYPHFVERLHDAAGRPVGYAGVRGFDCQRHGFEPGSVEPAPGGWRLFCRDGIVTLAASPPS
jgi:methionyl-tRNA formyltransferase